MKEDRISFDILFHEELARMRRESLKAKAWHCRSGSALDLSEAREAFEEAKRAYERLEAMRE